MSDPGGGGEGKEDHVGGGVKKEVSDPGAGEEGGKEDPPTPSATPNAKAKQHFGQRAFETNLEFERKPNIEELNSVKQEKQTGSIFCRICYCKFTQLSEQIEHEKKVHDFSEEDQVNLTNKAEFDFSCNLCPLKFVTKKCLEIHSNELHKSSQPSSHKCKLCYKLFANPYGLRCHELKYHKNEKEYLLLHS